MRHMPLGCDRNHDRYWFFPAAAAGLYVEKGLFYILMSHLLADKLISVNCRQCTIRQLVSTSLGNSGLYWTVFTWNRDTAVPAEGNGNLQTLICVLVARSRRCTTLSNSVPWQNWMAAALCGWRCCFVADQLWFMTHTREEEMPWHDWLGFERHPTCEQSLFGNRVI